MRQASGEGRGLTRQESLTAGELELENRDWPEKYVEDDEEPIDDWSPRDSPLATPTSTVGTPRTPTPGAEGDEDDAQVEGPRQPRARAVGALAAALGLEIGVEGRQADHADPAALGLDDLAAQIGRASCRERV